MTSSEPASGGLAQFLDRASANPGRAIAEAFAVMACTTGNLVAFALPGESDGQAIAAGRVCASFGLQALELEHFEGIEPEAPGHWSRLAALILPLSAGQGGRYASFRLGYDLSHPEGLYLIPREAVSHRGRDYRVAVIRRTPSNAALVESLSTERTTGAERGEAVAAAALHAFATPKQRPMPYDGTEHALVMKVAEGDVRPLLARGRWLEFEQSQDSIAPYLEDAVDGSEPGLYLIAGGGWYVNHIPYEQDADAGFDGAAAPYAPTDAAIFGASHEDVIAEAEGQLDEGEPIPDFLR